MSKGKYGFGGGIVLPQEKTISLTQNLNAAIKASNELGFVNREPQTRLKPGPRQVEPQSKISIPGPKRVIDQYRGFCSEHDLTLWQGMEYLLNNISEERKR